jgi:hypothetical protein
MSVAWAEKGFRGLKFGMVFDLIYEIGWAPLDAVEDVTVNMGRQPRQFRPWQRHTGP